MSASWGLVTAPVGEPLSITEAMNQLRMTQSNDLATVESYLVAARQAAEAYLHRGLLTQTWQLGLECFEDCMSLPMAAPLQNDPLATPSTAPVVQYYDTNGTLQTLATSYYTVNTLSRPGAIERGPSQWWPALQADRRGARVLITYVVGWTSADEVPERIKQGIRLYLGWLDRDRDGLEAGGAMARTAAESCWNDVVYWVEPS